MMDNKTAIEGMCTLFGIEEFDFGFNEGLDEVHITKIHIPDDTSDWVVKIPSFVSYVRIQDIKV